MMSENQKKLREIYPQKRRGEKRRREKGRSKKRGE